MDMLIKMQKKDGRQHLQINGFALSTLVSGGFSKLLPHATHRRPRGHPPRPLDALLPRDCFHPHETLDPISAVNALQNVILADSMFSMSVARQALRGCNAALIKCTQLITSPPDLPCSLHRGS